MGLDIFLYEYDDYEATMKRQGEYQMSTEEIWRQIVGKAPKKPLDDGQKAELNRQLAALITKLDVNEEGRDTKRIHPIEMNSKKYPDHPFKIGYFRSSYNSSGLNHVLGRLGLRGLEEIFGVDGNVSLFSPDWPRSLKQVKNILVAFDTITKSIMGRYDVIKICLGSKTNDSITNEKEAMDVFMKGLMRQHPFESHADRDGSFFWGGIKVHAVIRGVDVWKYPCAYMVIKRSPASRLWYKQALEIVQETIEYVLDQNQPHKYYLRWSA